MSKKRRFMIAVLTAPMVAPCLYLIGILIFEFSQYQVDIDLETFFNEVLIFVTITSYLGFLLGGLPYSYFLQRNRRDSTRNLTLGGVFLGVVTFFLALEPLGLSVSALTNAELIEILVLILIGAALGGSVAFSFAKLRP